MGSLIILKEARKAALMSQRFSFLVFLKAVIRKTVRALGHPYLVIITVSSALGVVISRKACIRNPTHRQSVGLKKPLLPLSQEGPVEWFSNLSGHQFLI